MPQQRGTPGLLSWAVDSEELVHPSAPPPPSDSPALQLSVADRIAAPTAFVHQVLVFERALEAVRLHAAVAEVQELIPTLACRAAKGQGGDWQLTQPGAGACLTLGSSQAALQHLAPLPPPALAPLADLGAELFGHLPSRMPDNTAASAALPLLHVALVVLAGGGCVLGLRVSHMVADFGTVRATLHHLARSYSGRGLEAGEAPAPAAPMLTALAAATQLPPGFEPWNYRPLPPEVGTQFAALAAKPPLRTLRLHISPAKVEAWKAQALAGISRQQGGSAASSQRCAATGGADQIGSGCTPAAGNDGEDDTSGGDDGGGTSNDGGSAAGSGAWVSSNDALMAWLWKALAALPCRQGAVTPFNMALDMRRRMPAQHVPAQHPSAQHPPAQHPPHAVPRWVHGNLATSAYTPELDVAGLTLGQVALALRQTLARDAARFAGDVAFATQHAAPGGSCSSLAILPVLRILEAVAAGQVPLLMASQWALDYAADADFGGQQPLAAVPTFAPGSLVFPVAVSQAATAAAGGGVMLHLWLWPQEAAELEAAVAGEL